MFATTDLSALFQPFSVHDLTVKNRFAMSAMQRVPAPNGVPGEDMAQFYRRRVEGEFGLIFTGGICIDHPASTGIYANRPCEIPVLDTPEAKAGWKRVTSVVHEAGGKIIAQLLHIGLLRIEGTGYHPDAKSSRPSGIFGPIDRPSLIAAEFAERLAPPNEPLTDAEIVEIIASYGRAARDAMECGFDGVEIHGAQGYLPDAFMWDVTNKRTDRWGGNRRERVRFAGEVVRAARAEIGENKPMFYRFSHWKHQDLDATLARNAAELEEVVGPLAEAGVDVFDVGHFYIDRPMYVGSDLNLAGWCKKLTGRAAIGFGAVGLTVGQHDPSTVKPPETVNNLAAVNARLERGEFDLFALGRASLIDPAFPRKIRLGEALEPFSKDAMRGAPR
jgi:2,4-dienoyl-CoA reductase-like NADH-dependent reductase (Old Yellow Enzyme family)